MGLRKPHFWNVRTCFVVTCVIGIVVLLTIMEFDRLFNCDEKQTRTFVRTPEGKYIQKMGNFYYDVKKYSVLSTVCHYNEQGKINCPDVRMKGETLIRQIQLAITRMVLVVDLICKKHGIKYWLMSGALLGAVRDKGFVPWDNDADIGMLKEDYDKFRVVAMKDLPSDLMLQNTDTDPYYHVKQQNEAKLRDLNSCYALCVRYGCKRNDGLMLDIFVMVNSAKDKVVSKWGRFEYNMNELLPTREVQFEGFTFPAPQQYDKILEGEYGDILTLPPESKQCPTKGYIGHPWYSCKSIAEKPDSVKKRIIEESRISNDWILYYTY